ncbi:UNKNOWN [Stylonychia lemnae]|uniref:Uncharacterized protein n=1 Tax=Stylonychia lemnae TaxID=5949 RepID=A0A077ZY22_STYLE|nr:UNKNOWN [Stylonychia lemnae]|eukprot:CDW74780.1 UNKNOWN [Stylonychia lemnae]
MSHELSRDDKKLQQLIALIEKREHQERRKQEKKKLQETNQIQQVVKKSQSVNLPPTVKSKPKIEISFAAGALEQNSRYMHQQQERQRSSQAKAGSSSTSAPQQNWQSWNRSCDQQKDGTSLLKSRLKSDDDDDQQSSSSESIIGNHDPYKRRRINSNEIPNDNEASQYSNGRDKVINNSQSQLSSNYESPQQMTLPDKPVLTQQNLSQPQQTNQNQQNGHNSQQLQSNQEDFKSDEPRQNLDVSKNRKNSLQQNSQNSGNNVKQEDETSKIFEATLKLQNEMRKAYSHFGKPFYEDQLYLNIKEGRSLKTALLIKARFYQ